MVVAYSALLCLFICWYSVRDKEKKRFFFWAAVIVIFLMTVLKSKSFGSDDLENYYNIYNSLPDISFGRLWKNYRSGDMKDVGFFMVAKLFADAGIPVQLWVGLIGLLYAFSIMSFSKKYSADMFFSCLILFSLAYLSFSFTALRQTVAMSIVFFAISFANKRKLIPFVILVVFASLFHSTALIFLLVYLIPQRKFYIIPSVISVVGCLAASIFAPGLVRRLISILSWNEFLQDYAEATRTLTFSGFIIQAAILAFCVYILRHKQNDRSVNLLLGMMVVGLCFQSFASVVAESFRMSMYFSIASVAVVPTAIDSIGVERTRKQYKLFVLVLLLIYFTMTMPFSQYEFFWS